MKKKITIGINVATLTGWGGGVDFFKKIIQSLLFYQKEYNLEIIFLVPYAYYREKKLIKKTKYLFDSIFFPNNENTLFGKKIHIIKALLNTYKNNTKIFFFDPQNYSYILQKINADLLLPWGPSNNPLPSIPTISYIFDFQHKYYPSFFSKEEYESREKMFSSLILKSKAIIVHSKNVEDDIHRFYPVHNCKIFQLPFAQIADDSCFFDKKTQQELLKNYNLPQKYFIISNQFWLHKNHIIAIEAFSKINDENIHLVMTGSTHDYRCPNYFDQEIQPRIKKLKLENRIHILGHIPKIEQIAIMKNAIALIQPTLFEGAPGGGSTSEALALGIPVILSDIPVNKEIQSNLCTFFQSLSSEDLANKMLQILHTTYSQKKYINPQKKLEEQIELFGKQLLNAIEYVIHNEKHP